jgi:hypothetical protein
VSSGPEALQAQVSKLSGALKDLLKRDLVLIATSLALGLKEKENRNAHIAAIQKHFDKHPELGEDPVFQKLSIGGHDVGKKGDIARTTTSDKEREEEKERANYA